MKIRQPLYLDKKLYSGKRHFPLAGQIELTYGCSFDCVHCYCKGSEDKKKELNVSDWKNILAQIQNEGCLWLGLTGGDPLTRKDFLEIYSYVKEKGFLVSILTNGYNLSRKILARFVKSPPYSLEITVNGITPKTFERVTQKAGSFKKVMENIQILKKMGIPVYIKTNCLTLNINEVAKIKQWVDKFLGKSKANLYYFSFDPIIFPGLNKDLSPCAYRISGEERVKIFRDDPDLLREYQEFLSCEFPAEERPGDFLYQCSSWKNQFVINPFGRLKFCQYTDRFSADLKAVSFRQGFYEIIPGLAKEKFKTRSKCRTCSVRTICYWCPVKASLETGNEEAPIEYYCKLAQYIFKQDRLFKKCVP